MTERNVQWVVCEMDKDMKNNVESLVNKAMDSKETEKDISEFIKKFFDFTYGPNWHCCVGKHFASYVTYQSKHYILAKWLFYYTNFEHEYVFPSSNEFLDLPSLENL